jgi:hypothetical protein
MGLAKSPLRHIFKHSAATNVQPDQHHLCPSTIPIQNTTQSVSPLPGGPGIWDVAVPLNTKYVSLELVSGLQSNDAGGKRGGRWIATRTAWLEATGMSFGGPTNWRSGSYVGAFTKITGGTDVSHRIWTTSGSYIALSDVYLPLTSPTTRVLRMVFTNYGSSNYILTVYGEIEVLG